MASFNCNRLLELGFIVVCGRALVGYSAGSFNADSSLSRISEALLCICKDVCSGLVSRVFEARSESGEIDLLRLAKRYKSPTLPFGGEKLSLIP